jgi:hypothetical protein
MGTKVAFPATIHGWNPLFLSPIRIPTKRGRSSGVQVRGEECSDMTQTGSIRFRGRDFRSCLSNSWQRLSVFEQAAARLHRKRPVHRFLFDPSSIGTE